MSSELPLHLEALHKAKTESGLTFAQIAEKVGKPEVWTAAVFYGQARPDEETATAIVAAVLPGSNVMLQVRGAVERVAVSPDIIVQELSGKGQSNLGVPGMVVRNQTVDSIPRVSAVTIPAEGLGRKVSRRPVGELCMLTAQDPVLYRFYEALMVYGQSYKSIIHEKVQSSHLRRLIPNGK